MTEDTDLKPQIAIPDSETASVLHIAFSRDRPVIPPLAVPIYAGATAVGRKVACGVRIDDSRISRHHATVHSDGRGRLRIVDNDSRNGTFVNGAPVHHAHLGLGDVISMGDSCFIVSDPPEPEPEPEDETCIRDLTGYSASMGRLRRAIARFGPTSLTVLLHGESGCGKELAARALHETSGVDGPFIAVNCAAVPESLFESQFFGHKAGAFTGATGHAGYFRAAENGTVFLDEVGELPLSLQPKLLRAIQERAITPIGATHPVACPVRILAATNRDLDRAAAEGTFRGDLLARLREKYLTLPTLRERREDILPLFARGVSRPFTMTHALAHALLLHSWPFNVRELVATARDLALGEADTDSLDVHAFMDRLPRSPSHAEHVPAAEERGSVLPSRSLDAQELAAMLREAGGNVADVARAAGRSRRQVYRWIQKYGIAVDDFRCSAR